MVGLLIMRLCVGMKKIQTFVAVALWFVGPYRYVKVLRVQADNILTAKLFLVLKTYADGSVYEGDWKDDKMHGEGKMTYANGVVYDGHWRDDKKHGEGILISIADGIVMMDIGGMANQIENLLQSVWCLRLSLQLALL
eukprot:scaffold15496_cov81-Skeletonema_dohrnii-CCMP3373.AAC.2